MIKIRKAHKGRMTEEIPVLSVIKQAPRALELVLRAMSVLLHRRIEAESFLIANRNGCFHIMAGQNEGLSY